MFKHVVTRTKIIYKMFDQPKVIPSLPLVHNVVFRQHHRAHTYAITCACIVDVIDASFCSSKKCNARLQKHYKQLHTLFSPVFLFFSLPLSLPFFFLSSPVPLLFLFFCYSGLLFHPGYIIEFLPILRPYLGSDLFP